MAASRPTTGLKRAPARSALFSFLCFVHHAHSCDAPSLLGIALDLLQPFPQLRNLSRGQLRAKTSYHSPRRIALLMKNVAQRFQRFHPTDLNLSLANERDRIRADDVIL